jgi:hypothetical protein
MVKEAEAEEEEVEVVIMRGGGRWAGGGWRRPCARSPKQTISLAG